MNKLTGEYRDRIKSGDLLVWGTNQIKNARDLQLSVVRFFTRSEYDHVGIAWVVGGRVFVIEATPPRVRIFPLSKLTPFYHVPMNIEWTHSMEERLLENVGDEYSVLQAIESYFTTPKKDRVWQCAELVIDFYTSTGMTEERLSGYTPSDVVRWCLTEKNTNLVLVL